MQLTERNKFALPAHRLIRDSLSRPTFLQMSSIHESTLKAYRISVSIFKKWLRRSCPEIWSITALDSALAVYATILYEENPKRGERQRFINTIFGLEFFVPVCKGLLREARMAAKGWNRVAPASSPPPLSLSIVHAISGFYLRRNKIDYALAFSLGFHGYLRSNELLSLRFRDLSLPGDARLNAGLCTQRAGLVVMEAKTGKLQFVPLSDSHLLIQLQSWTRQSGSRLSSDKVFDMSYGKLSRAFHKALFHLGLSDVGFTLHSLRHGGATHDFLLALPFKDIMSKGRWISHQSCERYLNAGKGLLVTISISNRSQRSIREYSSRWLRSSI